MTAAMLSRGGVMLSTAYSSHRSCQILLLKHFDKQRHTLLFGIDKVYDYIVKSYYMRFNSSRWDNLTSLVTGITKDSSLACNILIY